MKYLKALTPRKILFVFVALNLVLGLFIAADYGESTDEAFERLTGGIALSMYDPTSEGDPGERYENIGNKLWYGTAQTMLFRLAEDTIGERLDLPYLAVSHYTYFVTFQVAVVVLFFFLAQFVGEWAALLTAIMFGTQPLLFGHAFINPKDIPLLAIFLLTVFVGFKMVDRLLPLFSPDAAWLQVPWQDVKQRYVEILAKPPKGLKAAGWGLLVLLLLKLVLPPGIAWLVNIAYHSGEASLLGRLFLRASGQAGSVPVESYISKAQILADRVLYAGALAVIVPVFIFFLLNFKISCTKGWFKTYSRQIKAFTRRQFAFILLAGAVWGFALASRVVAFAAGGMVGLYLIARLRLKSVFPGLLYLLAAALICYLAWPYLWVYGFEGFMRALSEFSAFKWTGMVLFEGQVFTETTLPDYFVLKLIPLQFTLPLVLLAVAGMVLSVVQVFRRKLDGAKVVLLFAWFVLPLAYTYLTHSTNYDNFRQYLFVMVPLFVFAGVALEWLLQILPWQAARAALVVLVLLPGVFGLVRLHPYQYIYYNQLTGGVSGAFREYELDYWLTSYKEAAEYIDQNVPAGSAVLVWGGGRRVKPYLSNPYMFASAMQIDPAEFDQYAYVVITSEYLLDLQYHLEAETLFQVERDGVPLVFVKKLSP